MSKGVNAPAPTTAEIVGGVYNVTPPVLIDGQAAALQVDVNGKLITSGSGGSGNVNITGINGVPPALANPLPVELTDGTNAVGTAGNPLSVNVIAGGGSNASVGVTGATAPASATEVGIVDGTGKLQNVSPTNPLPENIAQWGGTAVQAAATSSNDGTGLNPVVRAISRRFGQILTTTPLGANATFTSAWFDTNQTGDTYVEAGCRQDQNGANPGLIIDQTDDTTNANFQTVVTTSQVFANTTAFALGVIQKRYWRVRMVNGATPQGSLEVVCSSISQFPFLTTSGAAIAATTALVVQPNIQQQNSSDAQTNLLNQPWLVSGGSNFGVVTSQVAGLLFNGSTWDRPRTPTIFKTVSATASGNTALWTPTAGKKFRLMRFKVEVTGRATAAAAADLTIDFQDATTGLNLASSVSIGTAGATTSTSINGLETGWIDLGNGFLSAAANNVLNVNLSFALTAGIVRVTCCGTEE